MTFFIHVSVIDFVFIRSLSNGSFGDDDDDHNDDVDNEDYHKKDDDDRADGDTVFRCILESL